MGLMFAPLKRYFRFFGPLAAQGILAVPDHSSVVVLIVAMILDVKLGLGGTATQRLGIW